MAVTRPIKYAKHKSNKRVKFTIAIVWIISIMIGSPIVLGLNTSPDRTPQLCIFYNSDFIIYSSLGSFYIPCLLMVMLYYRIFKAIRERARNKIGSGKGSAVEMTATTRKRNDDTSDSNALVIENVAQTKRQETTTDIMILDKIRQRPLPLIVEASAGGIATGKEEDDEEDEDSEDEEEALECKVIRNPAVSSVLHDNHSSSRVGSGMTGPRRFHSLDHSSNEERKGRGSSIPSEHYVVKVERTNGNTDSGYVASHGMEETQFTLQVSSSGPAGLNSSQDRKGRRRTGSQEEEELGRPGDEQNLTASGNGRQDKRPCKPSKSSRSSRGESSGSKEDDEESYDDEGDDRVLPTSTSASPAPAATTSVSSVSAAVSQDKKRKRLRFHLRRKTKSSGVSGSRKKEKASAKRERKATKTLAIVLGEDHTIQSYSCPMCPLLHLLRHLSFISLCRFLHLSCTLSRHFLSSCHVSCFCVNQSKQICCLHLALVFS